jgi:NitT/TauT family transport system permease protein
MLREPIAWPWHVALGVGSFLTLIAVYSALSWYRQSEDPRDKMLPNWSQLYQDGLLPAITPSPSTGKVLLWEDTAATFYRLTVGMIWIVVVSMIVGLLMGCYEPIEAFLLPPLYFWAKIPGAAMYGVLMIFVGLKDPELFVAMMVFGIQPTLTQTIYHAAKEDVPEELLFKARTLGASQAECIWDVIYKHILPKSLEAIRLSVGPAMVYLILTEWQTGETGLGCQMRLSFKKGAEGTPLMYVYVIALGLLGLVIDGSFRWIQRKLCPWYGH